MNNFTTIEEYNNNLIKNLNRIELIEYFKYVHHNFYKNINVTFMDYFLEICKNDDDFIIEHKKLQEYKVINNIDTSNKIERCLKQYNLTENVDYLVSNVGQVRETTDGQNRGEIIKKEYKLTPTAFKLCLIRAKNSKIYANYYLLLEKVFKYYNDYQIGYQEYLLSHKDEKIDRLNEKIDEQNKKIDELLNYGKDTKEQLNIIQEQNEELLENVEILDNSVDELYTKIDDIKEDKHEKCENENNNHFFSLIKLNKDEYKIINGTGSYNDNVIKKISIEDTLITKEYTPNARTLYLRFKEIMNNELKEKLDVIKNNKTLKNKIKLKKQIKENVEFSVKYSKIYLIKGTEETLINKLLEVNNKRYNVFDKP